MVTLNVDIGELPDEPEELYGIATVVNVACGGHAGDDASMARAIDLARASGAEIAAHPSYPDRLGFGRKTMTIGARDLADAIAEQCAALQRIASSRDVTRGDTVARADAFAVADAVVDAISGAHGAPRIRVVKLHGALYHDAAKDPVIAEAVMEGAARGLGIDDVTWIGPARGEVWSRAKARGLAYVREGFADRGTLSDGSLVPRGQPGALIEDPDRAAAQAILLAKSGAVDSLCVHSDTPGAVTIARAVRHALVESRLLRGVHTIDVVYDGPDLDDVASALGVTRAEIIAMHTGREHRVQIVGFLPGFAYMGPVDPRLVTPRRGAPRPRVEPQSVAIAGPYTGIYPIASPGGWNLIGRSLGPLPFDPSREEPFLFTQGDRVRFRAVEGSHTTDPNNASGAVHAMSLSHEADARGAVSSMGESVSDADARAPVDKDVPARCALIVKRAAGIATIQDAGRIGFLSRGVPPSGPIDPDSFEAANRAVHNDVGAAAIELLAGSLVLRARGSATLSIDGEAPITLADGEEICVTEGARAARYVAVRGGVDVPLVLGSRSTLLTARIGGVEGRPLRRGDVLGVLSGQDRAEARLDASRAEIAHHAGQDKTGHLVNGTALAGGADNDMIVVGAGPDLARFPDVAMDVLLRSEWLVSRLVDRTGMRLTGASIPRSGADSGAPTPMQRGAIQVTTDGTPIVLGPDHPTTGGYPVIAIVREECFGRLARRRAGEGVRFRLR